MAFKRKEYHKEENCLNCGYPLIGSYCGNCGQKAFLNKDSFLHMVAHFIGDYFHYDNKFWVTIKTLFATPGQATLGFVNGKRAKYLNPIQLYFFVTSIFFLLVFSYSDDQVKARQVKKDNSVVTANKDTSMVKLGTDEVSVNYNAKNSPAINLQQYDSIQNALPEDEKDNFMKNYFSRKFLIYEDKYKGNGEFNKVFLDKLLHNFPKVFFILLPFFAFLLLLVNFRRRIYFIDHLVFSLHFHSVLFIILTFCRLVYIITASEEADKAVTLSSMGGMLVYLFISFRKVYPVGYVKAFIKLLFLFFSYLIGFFIALALIALYVFSNM